MSTEERALTPCSEFVLPAMAEGEFTNDEIAEDMQGMHLHFQRIKIPAGGALQFEVPGDDPEAPEYAKGSPS